MRTSKILYKVFSTIIWSILTLITLFPIYWMILVSTRTPVQLFGKPNLAPTFFEKIYWKNYTKPFVDGVFGDYLLNSRKNISSEKEEKNSKVQKKQITKTIKLKVSKKNLSNKNKEIDKVSNYYIKILSIIESDPVRAERELKKLAKLKNKDYNLSTLLHENKFYKSENKRLKKLIEEQSVSVSYTHLTLPTKA